MAAKKNQPAAPAPAPTAVAKPPASNEDMIVHVLKLDEIDHKSYKNSRSGDWLRGTDPTGVTNDFEGLCASIAQDGQDEPVTVRPIKSAKGTTLQLVAGFRRYAAHKHLGLPTIKAFIRELTDIQARALNLRENTARNNLSGPDLAWAIWDLYNQQLSANKSQPPTAVGISQEIGRNQSYVNSLITVMREVDPKVTQHWRANEVQLPVKFLERVAKEKDKSKHWDTYENEFKRVTAQGSTSGRGIEGLKKRATDIGTQLGTWARLKLIVVDMDWVANLGHLVKLPADGITPEVMREVGHMARDAYIKALEYTEPEPKPEGEKAGKGGKGKGGNAAKGAEGAPAAN